MATYNGNSVVLTIDGVDIATTYWQSVTLERSGDSVDTTAGSGATHRSRNAGLKDTSITIKVVYSDSNLADYIAKLNTGQKYTIIVGPEGNTAGKPKHEQSFVIESISGFEVNVEKPLVGFELSGVGAAAPTTDLFAGGTY